MPIDTLCPGCQAKLRMGDEYAGQQARCPVCNEIYLVPELKPAPVVVESVPVAAPIRENEPEAVPVEVAEVATPAPAPLPPADGTQWYLRTPEGPIYGPVTRETFERWVQEGRVTPDCQICAGDNLWNAAPAVFPQLVVHKSEPARPIAPESWQNTPHRGTLILMLGILGVITTCPIPGVMAWVMGSHDLIEMREGRMDTSGLGATQAGRLLGMLFSMIYIVGTVLAMFAILFVMAR